MLGHWSILFLGVTAFFFPHGFLLPLRVVIRASWSISSLLVVYRRVRSWWVILIHSYLFLSLLEYSFNLIRHASCFLLLLLWNFLLWSSCCLVNNLFNYMGPKWGDS